MNASVMTSRQHAAVEVCESLGLRDFKSTRIEALKHDACTGSVFRLQPETEGSESIIAKYCPMQTGMVERRVYEEILRGSNVAIAPYHGWFAADEDEFCWIILGEVHGANYSPRRAEHRDVAGRWLAGLHAALLSVERPANFPDRGPTHYHDLLEFVDARLAEVSQHRECGNEERVILNAIRRHLDRIASRWNSIASICETMPLSLVHGDFVTHNAYVRSAPTGPVFIPIDWEKAGWGTPAEDLSEVDVDAYCSSMARHSEGCGREHYATLARVGRTFRCLVFLDWAVPVIGGHVDGTVWSHLQQCRSWLDELG
jgi:thiamine kinase-like enzyme